MAAYSLRGTALHQSSKKKRKLKCELINVHRPHQDIKANGHVPYASAACLNDCYSGSLKLIDSRCLLCAILYSSTEYE